MAETTCTLGAFACFLMLLIPRTNSLAPPNTASGIVAFTPCSGVRHLQISSCSTKTRRHLLNPADLTDAPAVWSSSMELSFDPATIVPLSILAFAAISAYQMSREGSVDEAMEGSADDAFGEFTSEKPLLSEEDELQQERKKVSEAMSKAGAEAEMAVSKEIALEEALKSAAKAEAIAEAREKEELEALANAEKAEMRAEEEQNAASAAAAARLAEEAALEARLVAAAEEEAAMEAEQAAAKAEAKAEREADEALEKEAELVARLKMEAIEKAKRARELASVEAAEEAEAAGKKAEEERQVLEDARKIEEERRADMAMSREYAKERAEVSVQGDDTLNRKESGDDEAGPNQQVSSSSPSEVAKVTENEGIFRSSIRKILKKKSILVAAIAIVVGRRLVQAWFGRGLM